MVLAPVTQVGVVVVEVGVAGLQRQCAQQQLTAVQDEGQTIVDYLIGAVLKGSSQTWRHFVIGGVSDVDDARCPKYAAAERWVTRHLGTTRHEQRVASIASNLFDLTRQGRPTDWDEQLSYPDRQ